MHLPDLFNGIFEALGAIFTWRNALSLYRDKEIKGVYWPAWVFFSAWGIWNLYYYPALGQWLSFSAGLLLVSGNLVWVALAIRLKLFSKQTAMEPPIQIGWGSGPAMTRCKLTQCVPCNRTWVPWIYGPRAGQPCPFCTRAVTELP